jgi:hypothetical protein
MSIWSRKKRSIDGDEPVRPVPRLADECEAYLAGRYEELSTTTPGRMPAWVHLNEVAHAPLATLVVVSRRPSQVGAPGWDAARASVARMLVDAAHGDPDQARQLQLDILQPLESRVSQLAEFITPRRLVEIVESSLVSRGA